MPDLRFNSKYGNFYNLGYTCTEKNYKSVPNEIDFAVANNNFLLDATTAFVDATNSVRWRDEQCSLARRTIFFDLIYEKYYFLQYIYICVYMYIYNVIYTCIYIYMKRNYTIHWILYEILHLLITESTYILIGSCFNMILLNSISSYP